jgi:hypothetical protein
MWLIGLGIVFLFNFNWPVILILIGLSMLFGYSIKGHWDDSDEKPKNDQKRKHDDLETDIV